MIYEVKKDFVKREKEMNWFNQAQKKELEMRNEGGEKRETKSAGIKARGLLDI